LPSDLLRLVWQTQPRSAGPGDRIPLGFGDEIVPVVI
jgi:hypothetical protein